MFITTHCRSAVEVRDVTDIQYIVMEYYNYSLYCDLYDRHTLSYTRRQTNNIYFRRPVRKIAKSDY